MGIGEILTIILAVAKLTGHFAHSWLWVFAPMLAVYAVVLLFLVGAGILAWRASK